MRVVPASLGAGLVPRGSALPLCSRRRCRVTSRALPCYPGCGGLGRSARPMATRKSLGDASAIERRTRLRSGGGVAPIRSRPWRVSFVECCSSVRARLEPATDPGSIGLPLVLDDYAAPSSRCGLAPRATGGRTLPILPPRGALASPRFGPPAALDRLGSTQTVYSGAVGARHGCRGPSHREPEPRRGADNTLSAQSIFLIVSPPLTSRRRPNCVRRSLASLLAAPRTASSAVAAE